MEQYWINRNGQQSGPFDFEQLKKLQIDDETYVWYNGLEDWTQLVNMPDLAQKLRAEEPGDPITVPPEVAAEAAAATAVATPEPVLEEQEGEPAESVPNVPTVPPVAAATPVPQGIPVGVPVGVPIGTPVNAPAEEPAPAPAAAASEIPPVIPPAPASMPAPAAAPAQPAPTAAAASAEDKCPPTNLVWAIITLVLCCVPFSAVAIFMGIKVKNCWSKGEKEKAKKWSDRGAWMIIASIIAGILVQPFISFIMSSFM